MANRKTVKKRTKSTNKAVPVKPFGVEIRVLDSVECWNTRDATPNDPWDRDDTAQSHSIEGIVVGEGYCELTVGFDVEYDKDYYLLYGLYSTGDSFGHDEGRICFVDLYKSPWKAEKAAEALRIGNAHSVKIKNEADKAYLFGVPWHGYFESLNRIEIETVRRKMR